MNTAAVVLDLEDPFFDGQTLPNALGDYEHVHSVTGVCVKNTSGPRGANCEQLTIDAEVPATRASG